MTGRRAGCALYVPIALIVIVNSSHVARVAGNLYSTATGDDGKHRSARTDSAKRPRSSTGLSSLPKGGSSIGNRRPRNSRYRYVPLFFVSTGDALGGIV